MTDITELAQDWKTAAHKAKQANDLYLEGKITLSECVVETKDYLDYSDNPNNILALVEVLEKAQEEAEELSKFKEVMTSAAEALKAGKPLNLESLFKGELASAMFAMMFAGEFVRSGATNYLELLYDVPEFGEMTVTLQKVVGKTPAQRIAELESRAVSAAAADVLAERQRQVTAEGWSSKNDDQYKNTELAFAASCYAFHAAAASWDLEDDGIPYDSHPVPKQWPWDPSWWKPTDARRDLVKAGALILAEIERIDRAAGIKWEGE